MRLAPLVLVVVLALAVAACGSSGGASSADSQKLTAAGLTSDQQLILSGVSISGSDYLAFVHDDGVFNWPGWCASTTRPEPLANYVQSVRSQTLSRGVTVSEDALALAVKDSISGALVSSSFTGNPSDIQRATQLAASVRC